MRNILLIIQREYLTRVKSKVFILSTFLTPFLFAALLAIPIIASINVEKESVYIYVEDLTGGEILTRLKSDDQYYFEPASNNKEYYISELKEGEIYLQLDASFESAEKNQAKLLFNQRISLQVKEGIEKRLKEAMWEYRLHILGVDENEKALLDFDLSLKEEAIAEAEGSASTEVATAAGYVMSLLIYMMLILYGMFVMRGVIEEKTNRIIEVMVSSVKPFQLMMGKILGIGAVGLTQFLTWILMIFGLVFGVAAFIASQPDLISGLQDLPTGQETPLDEQMLSQLSQVLNLKSILLFIFYFLGGFLLYGSLFAAVGSAVDQESDAQQLTWPIIMPLVLPMLVLGNILQNPSGTLATFFSIFPLFSPTVMMIRSQTVEVPITELILSMVLLLLAFVACVWLASRIYRVGILMYGKKVSIKEIIKWVFTS